MLPAILKKITRSWLLDLLILAGVVAGIAALIYHKSVIEWYNANFDSSLAGWFTEGLSVVIKSVQTVQQSITIWVFLGVLIGGFLVFLIVWRILWRLRSSRRFTSTHCPNCSFPLSRIKRTGWERLASKIVPMRKFYCKRCQWRGLRIKPVKPLPLNATERSVKSSHQSDQIEKIDMT